MSRQNAEIAKRWFEQIWNERRPETAGDFLAPDSVCMSPAGRIDGMDKFMDAVYTPFATAFPDFKITIEDVISQDDQVAVRWTATGTHTGDGFGFPATGKSISVPGVTWIRFEAGKMLAGWDHWDYAGLMQYLRTDQAELASA